MTITTEFGREAPKAVADFADKQAFKLIQNLNELNDKNIDITSDEYQNTIKEIDKWSEGGIYRVALHTAAAALATGTVEGAASAGGTAYAIPKIDEYLKEQGFDETARHSALLALSAGLGASIGGDTASTVNNVGQTQWNYLYHESALKSSKLNARQRRHIQALKDAGAVSYEEIEKKYDNCKGNKECEVAVKKEWQRESDRTRQIELDLVKQGVLTWEDFDQFTGGFIGVDTPHLAAIQNKRHTLAAMEISSWTQPDVTARNEALRRDGGVTPGSTEDLLMQAGAGTVGAAVAGRGSRTPTKANNQTLSPVTPIANSGAAYRQNIITVANNRQLTQMPITINNKTYQPIAQPTTAGAPIYRGVSTQDIYQAFKDIAGIKTLPQTGSPMYQAIPGKTSPSGKPGYIIKVPQSDGSTVLLRNFATSNREHPVRFTIEIQRSSTSLGPKKLELKFE